MNYKKNMEMFEKIYPKEYKKIKEVEITQDKYEIISTRSQNITLRIKNKNKVKFLHSRYNPEREALQFVKENYEANVTNYIVWGMGFGYHIKELVKKAPKANIHIIEMNIEVLKLALQNIECINILASDNIKIHVIFDVKEIGAVFSELLKLKTLKVVIHNPSLTILDEKYNDIKLLLEEFIIKCNSVEKYSESMGKNYDININTYDKGVSVLFNKHQNIPIFIIAAGPSLDKNINQLAQIGDRGIIFAVGRAVKPLIKAGIKIDYIIVTESSPLLYSMQLENVSVKCPIIALSTCDPAVFQNYEGTKYIAFQKGYEKAENYADANNFQLVETGGSVATTALDIAIKMGGNPIVFVGQDLAYTDNKTHAGNTESKDILEFQNLRMVKDIYGGMAYTSINLNIYLRWIQNRISGEENITFIDATEGGALIKGTKIQTLEKTIDYLK